MFDKIHSARLTALADHLETAETLLVGNFNFSIFYDSTYYVGMEDIIDLKEGDCKSAGCAIGEAAHMWPDHFPNPNWDDMQSPSCKFFGLRIDEFEHLFIPGRQDNAFGGSWLTGRSTRHEVAAGIRAFLEVKRAFGGI